MTFETPFSSAPSFSQLSSRRLFTTEMKSAGETSCVKVFARIRPFTQSELAKGSAEPPFTVSANAIKATASKQVFSYEMCFCAAQGQEQRGEQRDVYAHLGPPLVDCALSGLNGCLMAYGQTGSGKTHTMMGGGAAVTSPTSAEEGGALSDHRGVIPRFADEVFAAISREQDRAATENAKLSFRVTARYFEIYCEKAYDLLTPSSATTTTEVRLRDNGRIEGLKEEIVTSSEAVLQLINKGNRNRTVAATLKNERSSRSHAIFQLSFHQDKVTVVGNGAAPNATRAQTLLSTISLVDLAGSERQKQSGAEGQQFKEMVNINLSLSTLRRVIQTLYDNASKKASIRPPIRDSLLTHILGNSFGGNSKTFLLLAMSPAASDWQDTHSTLEFGNVARQVINTVSVNMDGNSLLLKSMSDEITRLKLQLAERNALLEMAAAAGGTMDALTPRSAISEMLNKAIQTDLPLADIGQLESQIAATQSLFTDLQEQLSQQTETNIYLMEQLREKDEAVVALQRQVLDTRRMFQRDMATYFKSRPDVLSLVANLRSPLQQQAGCPQCSSFQTELFVVQTRNTALSEELSVMTEGQERMYVDMERLRLKHERTIQHLAELMNQQNVVEDREMIIAAQKERISELEMQIGHHLEERVALLMDSHRLSLELQDVKSHRVTPPPSLKD